MRSVEDKGCLSNGPTAHDNSGGKASRAAAAAAAAHHHHSNNRTALGKPTPSKWDDAQKWLVNLSRAADKNPAPRNSNADDLRLIAPVPKKDYSSGDDDDEEREKNVVNSPVSAVRPICLRDMGTEMTPIASQEPSRAATPVRASSPMSSGSSTPVRRPNGAVGFKTGQSVSVAKTSERECAAGAGEAKQFDRDGEKPNADEGKLNSLEIRAMAWEEAERVKNMARFKREEVKIQAWENHRKRKAEMENRKAEVKAERLKSRAQEKYNTKIAATRRIAEEKRANAEAKLQEKALRTSERADYIRRNGHLPSSCCFSFKWRSLCW